MAGGRRAARYRLDIAAGRAYLPRGRILSLAAEFRRSLCWTMAPEETPNESLPVVVIGVGGFGRWTLQALRQSPVVEVVGVSDRDPVVADEAARTFGLPAYSDNRSLLAETRPKAAYLAVPPMAAAEPINLCAGRGVHVWKEPPLGRNLDEAVAFVRRMEKARLKLAVGTQRRFAAGYRRAWELRPRLGRVFLGRAHYLFNWGPTLGWRGDRASGGGALLELGYHPMDLLVWMLGLPGEVYGLSVGNHRPASQGQDAEPQPIYDTDDTAAALLRYRDGCMASVVTTRRSGPVSEGLSLHGRGGSLTACGEQCLLRDPDGSVLDQTADEGGPQDVFRRQAEAFARSVALDATTYECSGRENLLTQAVIEAIYLSNQTCQPETPTRLLRTRDLRPEECLTCRPPLPADEPETEGAQEAGEG
jgi:predicted dehydrogenase